MIPTPKDAPGGIHSPLEPGSHRPPEDSMDSAEAAILAILFKDVGEFSYLKETARRIVAAGRQAAPQPEGGPHYLCTKCGHVGTEPHCRCGYAALLIPPNPRTAALEAALRDLMADLAPGDHIIYIGDKRQAAIRELLALTTARAGKGEE